MDSDYNKFFKCIHLKGEIGAFALYRKSLITSKTKNPIIYIKAYDGKKKKFTNFYFIPNCI